MIELIIFSSVSLCSPLLIGMVRRYAMEKGLVDSPNERSAHVRATSRGGGLSMVLTFVLLLILLYAFMDIPKQYSVALLMGGILTGGVGLADDHRHIPPAYRALVHAE